MTCCCDVTAVAGVVQSETASSPLGTVVEGGDVAGDGDVDAVSTDSVGNVVELRRGRKDSSHRPTVTAVVRGDVDVEASGSGIVTVDGEGTEVSWPRSGCRESVAEVEGSASR